MKHKKENSELNEKLDILIKEETNRFNNKLNELKSERVPVLKKQDNKTETPTREQQRKETKLKNLLNAPNVIITTKEKKPTKGRVTRTKNPLKINPDNCQSGKPGSEPKEICPHCGEYMYKQSSRCYVDNKPSWVPTSWLCRRCGKMLLDMEGFKAVKI
jgi:hypothetical protein